MISIRSINKGKQMIISESKYQLWFSPAVKGIEPEFFLCAFDELKDARRHSRKMLNYPGIAATWIVRSKDSEVVQPHEKF